jgi:hypothetical protein
VIGEICTRHHDEEDRNTAERDEEKLLSPYND